MHTPLPWIFVKGEDNSDGDGSLGSIVSEYDDLTYIARIWDDQPNAAADAALIIQAVNSHEAMVEELKKTRMNALAPTATDWDIVVERIDKALAMAEGKAQP